MTDLELLELLNESGFEPSIENLISLKEELEAGNIEILTEARASTKKIAKAGGENSLEYLNASKEEKARYQAYYHGKEASKKIAKKGDNDPGANQIIKQGKMFKKIAKKEEKKSLKEEYSDYELYQLLENNGYKTTEENLSILKEGLDSGIYELID